MSRILRASVIADSRVRLEYPALLELLARYASSLPARRRILALEPGTDAIRVEAALMESEEFRELLRRGAAPRFHDGPDLGPLLAAEGPAADRPLRGEELGALLQFLQVHWRLGILLGRQQDLPNLAARGRELVDPAPLRERLEQSLSVQGEVLSTASAQLARLRAEAEALRRELRAWMERRRQSPDLRGVLQDDVITVRNGRLVFAVRIEHRHRVRGLVHGQSASGQTLFVEPEAAVLRGNQLVELEEAEQREIARILAELSHEVRRQRVELSAAFERVLALEIALARGRLGEALGGVRPVLTGGRDLRLEEARHPLLLWRERDPTGTPDTIGLERARTHVVPLSVELGSRAHVLIVTGPNTGGKTVVLKTVGLLCLMAATGIPIPAAPGSRVPLSDAVLADIGDEQSLEQNLSTFSSHMTHTAHILSLATARSLVLLDELGAGTDPLEGAALGEAILEQFYARGALVLVTTHLGSLKEFAFRRRKCLNACMEFDPQRLAPTYRLIVGLPGRSNALIIARRIGVSAEVVDHAEHLLGGAARPQEELIQGLERTHRQWEQQRAAAERERRETERLRASALEETKALERMRTALEHEAERVEEERVLALVATLEQAVKQLGEPPRERRPAYEALLAELTQARRSTRLAERRRATARRLKKGDPVFVPRLCVVAEVRKINKERELITVTANGLPLEIGFDDISWILPPPGYELAWYEARV